MNSGSDIIGGHELFFLDHGSLLKQETILHRERSDRQRLWVKKPVWLLLFLSPLNF